jgi:beta-lactam-binding protein with PASTA domain
VAIAYKHVKEDPDPPSRLNSDVPAGLNAIVMKALAKNPANRYQSADALAKDLERFRLGAEGQATPVLPVEPTQFVDRATRQTTVLPAPTSPPTYRRRRWGAVVVLLVLLGVLGVGLFLFGRSLLGKNVQKVPNVTGKDVAAAKIILANNGFKAGKATEVESSLRPGVVVDYSPKEAEPGSAIDLKVSNGAQVPVVVPDVTCQSRSDAIGTLRSRGFRVRSGGFASNNLCNPGEVSKEQPPGESTQPKGSIITIFLVPEASPSPSPLPSPSPSPSPLPSPSPSESVSPSPSASASPSP